MTSLVDWDSVSDGSSTSKGKKGKASFMRLGAGTYQVRLLGSPVHFYKFMVRDSDGKWHSAVCTDAENNPVSKKHNIKPTERYAVLVIDRADGEVKILEAGVSVFKEFRAFFKHTGKNPGGANGADFRIVIEGSGRTKKYSTSFVKNTPLTDEEVSKLKEMKKNTQYPDLEKVYEAVENDKIEEKLFGAEAASSGSQGAGGDDLGLDGAPNGEVAVEDEAVGDDLPF